ncbi:hypothetical protein ACOSQ3_001149 [Xanthoceras sorbifolium]
MQRLRLVFLLLVWVQPLEIILGRLWSLFRRCLLVISPHKLGSFLVLGKVFFLLRSWGFLLVLFEADAVNVIEGINRNVVSLSSVGNVISDIKVLCKASCRWF